MKKFNDQGKDLIFSTTKKEVFSIAKITNSKGKNVLLN